MLNYLRRVTDYFRKETLTGERILARLNRGVQLTKANPFTTPECSTKFLIKIKIESDGWLPRMGIFDAFKSKKETVDLPPPPMPDLPESDTMPSDLEMPELPEPESSSMENASADEHTEEEHEDADMMHAVRHPSEGPLFVSVQDYQAVLNGVSSIRAKLGMSDDSFKKLQEIKHAQDKSLETWRGTLEDVQRKLTYVDEVLFGK